MSKQEVENFFNEYIFGFIFSDIQREINLARSGKDAGNFLSALGLLCYTEFMGGIAAGSFRKKSLKSRFDTFFNLMGKDYEDFNKNVNVYKVFRCGMAHEYFIKRNCTIAMLKNNETIGIGLLPNRQYYFVVEKYFEDFSKACRSLCNQMMAKSNPSIPR